MHLPLPLPGEVAVGMPLHKALVTSCVVYDFHLSRLVMWKEEEEEEGGVNIVQEIMHSLLHASFPPLALTWSTHSFPTMIL